MSMTRPTTPNIRTLGDRPPKVAGFTTAGEALERSDLKERLLSSVLLEALKGLLPEGWGDDDTMDHMPGVKAAREAIALAEQSR